MYKPESFVCVHITYIQIMHLNEIQEKTKFRRLPASRLKSRKCEGSGKLKNFPGKNKELTTDQKVPGLNSDGDITIRSKGFI